MDYLSDKLNSVTGRALSSVNDMKHKRKPQDAKAHEAAGTSGLPAPGSISNLPPPSPNYTRNPTQPPVSQPFGGDTYSVFQRQPNDGPPPIGFHLATAKEDSVWQKDLSDQSLYQGDTWSRLWFQRVMILTLLRLVLFIRKVYEDYRATKHYSSTQMFGHFLLALATLLLPTLIFTVYRLARYLQLALGTTVGAKTNNGATNDESRALMSPDTPAPSSPLPPPVASPEEDGLVTARQTPTNLQANEETYHEAHTAIPTSSPSPSTAFRPAASEEMKETVEIHKLGALPDREGTRILIGASEQVLHGVLFIFWQLKRQVDVVGYLVERSCLWRKPKDDEKRDLDRLATGSDGLEWFQDFYAAFLATLTQVYALGLHWTSPQLDDLSLKNSQQLSAAQSAIGASGSDISQTAKAISNTLGQQQALGSHLGRQDLLIMSQLVVSLAVISSLLVAVRRRDDGPLTLLLSMVGWANIFGSRIIVIALAFVHIGWRIMLPLIMCHIFGIAAWIYKIALDSHNDKPGESEEAKWDLELEETNNNSNVDNGRQQESDQQSGGNNTTDQWSYLQHLVLITQIIILFALPSLFYWPIMFNLKLHYRPFKYLVLVSAENFLLIPAIWFHIVAATAGQWYLLSAAAAFSTVGFIFIFLYVSCKPSLTEYFARADELFNEAERSGIYFEFCSRVFKLPDLSKQIFRRLMDQTEVVVTEEVDES